MPALRRILAVAISGCLLTGAVGCASSGQQYATTPQRLSQASPTTASSRILEAVRRTLARGPMAFRRTAIFGDGYKIEDSGLLSWQSQQLFDKNDDGEVIIQVQRDAFDRRPGEPWSGRNLLCASNLNVKGKAFEGGGESYGAASALLILGLLDGAGPTQTSRTVVVGGKRLAMDGVVVDLHAAAAAAPEPSKSILLAAAKHGPNTYGIAVGIGSDGLVHRVSLAYPLAGMPVAVVLDLFGYGARDTIRRPAGAMTVDHC